MLKNTYKSYPNEKGYFGQFGGRYVSETLMPLILEVEKEYEKIKNDKNFIDEFNYYLKTYVGRPSPLFFAERISNDLGGSKIYFKTDDGRKPKSSQMSEKQSALGWDIHVLYVEGKSVLEVYARSRQAMTEYELNHILQLQAGSGYWNRVSQPSPRASNDSVESDLPSAFGHEMERSDGQVRAKKIKANAIMLFDLDLDVRIAREQQADLQEQAPISVNGF